MDNIKVIDDWLDTAQLICTKTDGRTKYNFSNFTFPLKFALKIYRRDLTLQKVKDNQIEVKILMNKLNNDCNTHTQNLEKIKEKDYTLNSAQKLFSIREKLLKHLRKVFFRA